MTPLIDADVYSVTPCGRVWSKISNKFLTPYTGPNGYPYVTVKGKVKVYLHRLMASMFIPNPDNKPEVNHKNGDRSNFSPSNLEWVTASENLKHSYKALGRNKAQSYRHPNTTLTDDEILEIFSSTGSERSVARQYNVSARTVRNIRIGKTHGWLTKGGK